MANTPSKGTQKAAYFVRAAIVHDYINKRILTDEEMIARIIDQETHLPELIDALAKIEALAYEWHSTNDFLVIHELAHNARALLGESK